MTRTIFHTILLTLFALLYAADCAMPCIDGCGLDLRDMTSASVMVTADDHGDHDHGATPVEAHCDCHCLCACHLPVIFSGAVSAAQPPGDGICGGAYLPVFPISPVNPPDHIPLV